MLNSFKILESFSAYLAGFLIAFLYRNLIILFLEKKTVISAAAMQAGMMQR